MTEKRYKAIPETGSYKDIVTGEYLSPKFEKDYYKVLDLLNENEQLKSANMEYEDALGRLEEENEELKELLELISEARSFTKEESVKEILRHEIKAIDTVTEDSAKGWHDYGVLSNFFMKQYGEHWDNE